MLSRVQTHPVSKTAYFARALQSCVACVTKLNELYHVCRNCIRRRAIMFSAASLAFSRQWRALSVIFQQAATVSRQGAPSQSSLTHTRSMTNAPPPTPPPRPPEPEGSTEMRTSLSKWCYGQCEETADVVLRRELFG